MDAFDSSLPVLPDPHYEQWLPHFWHYLKWFLTVNQVWIMIGVGLMLAMIVLGMVVNIFYPTDKDDDDYDEEYY